MKNIKIFKKIKSLNISNLCMSTNSQKNHICRQLSSLSVKNSNGNCNNNYTKNKMLTPIKSNYCNVFLKFYTTNTKNNTNEIFLKNAQHKEYRIEHKNNIKSIESDPHKEYCNANKEFYDTIKKSNMPPQPFYCGPPASISGFDQSRQDLCKLAIILLWVFPWVLIFSTIFVTFILPEIQHRHRMRN